MNEGMEVLKPLIVREEPSSFYTGKEGAAQHIGATDDNHAAYEGLLLRLLKKRELEKKSEL